jgi:hypothetical protein
MEIIITSRLIFKDYLKFNFSHITSQPIFIYLFLVVIIPNALYGIADFSHSLLNTTLGTIFLFLFLLLPFITYISSKSHFNSNKRLTENIVYIINEDTISIKGESFNSMLTWNKVYKTRETKNAFLVYESNLSALIIPKRFFKNEEDIQLFRNIIPPSPTKTILRSKLFYLTLASLVIAIAVYSYASKDRFNPTSFVGYFFVLITVALSVTIPVGICASFLGSLMALIPSKKLYKERFIKLTLLIALILNISIALSLIAVGLI